MNTSNKIETLDLILSEMANANETFTGSKELKISDEYPTKFVFAYNPEYGIEKEISFGDVVSQNEGTKQYLSFPYTVLSDLNFNEHKWGLYVNETFSRMLKAFEGLKNASDTNNTRSISNNNKIISNFQLITKDLNEMNGLISLSDSFRNKISINRNFKSRILNQKQYSSNQVERVKIINWKLDQFVNDTIDNNNSILKENVIDNINIKNNTLTYEKMKLPYVRVKESETWATSENFSNVLIPIKAEKSELLEFLTRNDQVYGLSPKTRFINIGDLPESINYTNISSDIETNEYVELQKDIRVSNELISNKLFVIGNYFNLNIENDSKISVTDLSLKEVIVSTDIKIKSDNFSMYKTKVVGKTEIESNNIIINESKFNELNITINLINEAKINIISSEITKLKISFNKETTPSIGNINITNSIGEIVFVIDNVEFSLNSIKNFKEIKKYFKNINIG